MPGTPRAATQPHRSRFGPIEVAWDERVLEPRSWTLVQSRWAAALCEAAPAGRVLELCAGAGHIGLVAALLGGRRLVQVELDPVAASYARANAEAAGLAGRVEVRCCDLQEALRPEERFPLIIADPPYLDPERAARYPDDPATAIQGGEDGLDVVRSCLEVAERHLLPGGHLLLQLAGPAQAEAVAAGLDRLELAHTAVVDEDRAVAHLRTPAAAGRGARRDEAVAAAG